MISTFSPILDWRRKVPPPQSEKQKLWKHSCILKLLAGFGSRDINPRARNLQSTLLWRQTAKASEPLALPWLPVGTLWSNAGTYRWCQLMITIVLHLSNGISYSSCLIAYLIALTYFLFPRLQCSMSLRGGGEGGSLIYVGLDPHLSPAYCVFVCHEYTHHTSLEGESD